MQILDRTAIAVDHLSKTYSNGTAGLAECTFSLPFGSLVALLGPNGAGKSTLINLLAGALQPSKGVASYPEAGTSVAWSNQTTTIDWYLTVQRNIALGPRLYGLSRSESVRRTLRIAEELDLTDLLDQYPDSLSGGQQQRVQVARTLATEAPILLLDEPTVGLDVESAEAVLTFIRRRADEGALILLSSHDLGLLERYCDHVLLLFEGSLIANQSMHDFLADNRTTHVTRVQYQGNMSDAVMSQISTNAVSYSVGPPLTISSDRYLSLTDLIKLTGDTIDITDIDRERHSLRDVYLRLVADSAVSVSKSDGEAR